MARKLRERFAGALYHATTRGVERRMIFLGDDDRKLFLALLDKVAAKYGWVIHAYCLMGNHYHLVVETPGGNISDGMRDLNGQYAAKFNRKYGRTGHLFGGRFHSTLITKGAQLLATCRYVVLNAWRAGLCPHPRNWRWSSYNATVGRRRRPRFLTVDWLLRQFSPRLREARELYREFVDDALVAGLPPPAFLVPGRGRATAKTAAPPITLASEAT
jgi:REP element-mobilizing transposase RayT